MEPLVEAVLVVDPCRKRLKFMGRSVSLRRRTPLMKLFELMAGSEGAVSLHTITETLYQENYDLFRHLRKIDSLLDSAAYLLGRQIFWRTEKTLRVHPQIALYGDETAGHNISAANRRRELLRLLNNLGSQVRLEDLQKHFNYSRRLLLADLEFLRERNLVTMIRDKKDAWYLPTPGEIFFPL